MTMPDGTDAVLLLAYGGPLHLEQVRPILRRVVKTRPLNETLINDITSRYEQIGGRSPLPREGSQIARDLERRIKKPVFFATKYWYPTVSAAMQSMHELGIKRFVALPLSPFFNAFSARGYQQVARQGLARIAPSICMQFVDAFDELPLFTRIWFDALSKHLRGLNVERTYVLFTAHSIPLTFIQKNDRYIVSLRKAAARIAQKLSLHPKQWELCFQSAPDDKRNWIGPHVEERLPLIPASNFERVVVAPIGFVQDHIETLYDIDIVFAQIASSAHLTLSRPTMPNEDTRFVDLLSDAAMRANT
jgi:ferrochelatase